MTAQENSSLILRKLLIYKIIVFILIVGLFIVTYQNWQLRAPLSTEKSSPNIISDPKSIPYYKEIMEIIRPLDYSVVPSFVQQPDITLSIDFSNKTWTLHKFHQYDSDGNIILEDNRHGLCGELASFTYRKIMPLFGDRYIIKFAQVAQSGYFLHPSGSHVVLVIYDKATMQPYLLDPALHRYGPLSDYQDYLFHSYSEKVEGLDSHQIDVTYKINHGMPIVIYNNYISVFTIEDVNGKFDKDNFILSLQSNRRYDYEGRYIFALRKQNGQTDVFEDKHFENKVLDPQDFQIIKKTLTAWFNSVGN